MAEANLAIAQAELKQRQTDLRRQDLRADRRHHSHKIGRSRPDGRLLASGAGAVRDRRRPQKMELKAAIDEADIGGVHPGQKARLPSTPSRTAPSMP